MLLHKEELKTIFLRHLVKYFNVIIFLILLILGLISYYYLFLPKLQQIRDLKEVDLSLKQDDLSLRSRHLEKFNQLKKNYQSISATDLAKIKEVLPEEPDVPGLLVQLQNLGQEQGLQSLSITVSEPKEAQDKAAPVGSQTTEKSLSPLKNVKKLDVTLQYQGLTTYNAFKSFLTTFENNVRLFDIKSFGFTLARPGEKSGAINLSFTTYYLAP